MNVTLSKLGSRIREIRMAKNMTQNELANQCNFEKANLSRIESGRTNVTLRSLHRICKALEVDIAKLFEDEPVLNS
jgi:transcriptional regulator with XRE-family HTH domain